MSSRFGTQPVIRVIYAQGRTIAGTARVIGEDTTRFQNAAYGRSRPTELMRERLPGQLGVPLHELFSYAALRYPHKPRRVASDAPPSDVCGVLTPDGPQPICDWPRPCPVHERPAANPVSIPDGIQ